MLAPVQKKLVESLHGLGAIEEAAANHLIHDTELSGSELEDHLIEELAIDDVMLFVARARAYDLAPVNLLNFKMGDHSFAHLEVNYCRQHRIVPLGEAGSYLAIATDDPLNPSLKNHIERVTKKPFFFLLARPEHIDVAFDEKKGSATDSKIDFGEVVEALGMEFDLDTDEIDEKDFESEESGPIILLANRIIEDAYFSRASDIHIEPTEADTRIRTRIDGICRDKLKLPRQVSTSLVSRLKVMGNMDVAERRLPQDGRIPFKFFNRKGINIDLRLSTSPSIHGEGCVLRILDKQKSTLPLSELGYSDDNLVIYRKYIRRSYGMILHCGPTGSGKSMSLYSALNEINSPDVNIRTAEDPVEYTLPGITQVQMNRRIGIDFAKTLRAFLRQDPDIILVGEIRDKETARIATEAAMTGHLIFSTLHTNDAASTIMRLNEMGVERFLISATLICICAQRLARRLCDTCKQLEDPEAYEADILQNAINWTGKIYHPKEKGCPNCNSSGYRGRIGLHELMGINDTLVHAINMGKTTSEFKQIAIENGMRSLHQDSMLKVKQGLTSVAEGLATVSVDSE